MWTDETVKLIREHFIAAAVPTDLARAKTPEGEFLRSANIHKQWVTSSGYFSCVSPGGTNLGTMATAKVLEAFRALPEGDRKPGPLPDLKPDERVIPSPPAGGLVLRVHGRFLSRDAKGELVRVGDLKGEDFPQLRGKERSFASLAFLFEPNTEYLWLTADEVKALVPADPKEGATVAVPAALCERVARFHLSPRRALTSEDGVVAKTAVKAAKMALTVEGVTADRVRLRLTGFVHHGSDYVAARATSPNGPLGFGYETELHGILEYDRAKGKFVRFDVVAPGEVWGRWGDANGKSQTVERPGRSPVGFAFGLAGTSPTDRLPPGGHGGRALRGGYFTAAR